MHCSCTHWRDDIDVMCSVCVRFDMTCCLSVYVCQVPLSVSNLDFWSRYYFRRHQLDEEEARRVELMRRADEVQGEKEIGWDEGLLIFHFCFCTLFTSLGVSAKTRLPVLFLFENSFYCSVKLS